ncbi:hypothetical protein [Flavobacterium sp.]|uniref:hypothetical protein n=1 Tax=Flavobacterium sp. TaxID=239 RepID=UPI0025C0C317|nr:hypothetical protein [Flavobacterium sp.]
MNITPYEYYDNKLGVKIGWLICDRNHNPKSLMLISYNALYKRMCSNNCPETQLRRASLNYDALIEYNSLSRDWKDSLTIAFGSPRQEVKKSWFAQHYEADRKAFDFYAGYHYGEDNRKLDLKLIETYTYNASVLNAVLKLKENRKNYAKAIGAQRLNIWESLSNDVNAFREVEHNLPSTPRGLRMAVDKYLSEGYAGLISGRLQNQNASKLKEDKQLALIDELLAKHTNLDNTLVANLYNIVAEQMQWPTVTAQTVANRKEQSNLVVFAGRNGASALSNTMLMQNKRQAPTGSMLYWTLDGWDAELLYQKTATDKKGYATTSYHNRLTMIVVLDPFNKYPVGYAIGTHETPDLIKAALRNAYQHVYELFGGYFRPYQLQSDNYSISKLKPIYEAVSQHFTPAAVKNSKAKVIEPYFNTINKQYCKLFDNWSGHNVNSGSKNQPNSEYLNKIRNQFPDEQGCYHQLVSIIEQERAKKQVEFKKAFNSVSNEFKSELQLPIYLRYLGEMSTYTNRLEPAGLMTRINGVKLTFDTMDINFRKQSHKDWAVFYDPQDLSKVLVSDAKSKGGKLEEVIGTYEFLLEQKYVQPMALADRKEGDALKLQEVRSFNSNVIQYITDERTSNAKLVEDLFQNPQLNDTLAKHLLVDSRGQHKDIKSNNRLKPVPVYIDAEPMEKAESMHQQISEYNKSKIDINSYL